MRYAYWLANVKGVGNVKKHYLTELTGDARSLFEMPNGQLKQLEGLTEDEFRALTSSRRTWNIDQEWMHLVESGVGFVAPGHSDYPKRLQNISGAPYALYYMGKLPEENRKTVAIVGSRGRSAYGSEVARHLAQELSVHGVTVVSGMACGIDTDAHNGALDGTSETYAVLGCGVDVCYPRQNKYLYHRIIERGGILSEYPPGAQPLPAFFPERNRIISGLSDCVVVIEAKERSGSLITADFAMEQGKDVYAVPGRITDRLSSGCNRLIKQGAGVVQSVEDFLADLDIITENHCHQLDFRKNLLEKDERLVYSLTDFRPISLGTLVDKTGFSIFQLLGILEKLEALGLIKETFTNYYVRNIFR